VTRPPKPLPWIVHVHHRGVSWDASEGAITGDAQQVTEHRTRSEAEAVARAARRDGHCAVLAKIAKSMWVGDGDGDGDDGYWDITWGVV